MAIARGSGTEIIRSASCEDIDSTVSKFIIGEQHHIYTVLSIIIYAQGIASSSNYVKLLLKGYDTYNGTTAQEIQIFKSHIAETETYVWNDKFSFTGFEPVDFASADLTLAAQNAVADQGSSVVQKLQLYVLSADDDYDVTVTFIDQNNA